MKLIDANALAKHIKDLPTWWADDGGVYPGGSMKYPDGMYYPEDIISSIDNAPTVDAVVLPCKIGDDVYIIPSKTNFKLNVLAGLEKNNRVYRQKVEEIVFKQDCWYVTGNADKEYGTGRTLLDRFYKETWFLTEEEAKTALAKIDGGNENGVDD